MDRANTILGHLKTTSPTRQCESVHTARFSKNDDDVVIVSALRTPICKSRRGGLKDTFPDELLSTAFQAVLKESGVRPEEIQDICVGNVNQAGAGAAMARHAQFKSGIPFEVPIMAVNRQCSSGLQACMNIAGSIKSGNIDIGIGAGVETMTMTAMNKQPPNMIINPNVFEDELTAATLIPMGITSENVAERYGVDRVKQDTLACQSHAKAAKAQRDGLFDKEIVPVKTVLQDKDGTEKDVVIDKDDGIRAGTTMEILGRLKPAFKEGGTTTAGNSSQTSDGAAAVILARRSYARRRGLPVLGTLRSFAVVGVPPDVMGIGPAAAIPKALEKAGLGRDDIDIYEINEAFASQAYYCVDKLGIPMEKVNPKGGAVALGHPLGCTGARLIATLLHELKRRGKPAYGVTSMCIGTGMGAAAVFEYAG